MNKIKLFSTIFILSIILIGCSMGKSKGTSMTPLEIQTMQTRTYESNYSLTFNSVMSVFQDLGFTVEIADKDSGLIKSSGTTESSGFLYEFFTGYSATSQTVATATIEQIGKQVSVRLSFTQIDKDSSWYGKEDREDTQILDLKIYQSAFEKIENAIFYRENAQ
tara:strand:- start:157 stop:648 length:492 start_codon:yes stop_codon:yes gene_type:complete